MRQAIIAGAALVLPLSAALGAGAAIDIGTVYSCPNGQGFKVLACAGPAPGDSCDVQFFQGGQALMTGKSQRAQLQAVLSGCSSSTQRPTQPPPAPTARPPVASGVANQPPRPYQLHDKVQINIRGIGWVDGEIVSIAEGIEREYKIQASGDRYALASAGDLRFVAAAPAPASVAGKILKPGLVSCAGKFEGRYGPSAGPGPTIIFRAGKATLREPDMVMTNGKLTGQTSEREAECSTGGGKIYLRWLDGAQYDFPIDINDDGTLDTPDGEVRKKG